MVNARISVYPYLRRHLEHDLLVSESLRTALGQSDPPGMIIIALAITHSPILGSGTCLLSVLGSVSGLSARLELLTIEITAAKAGATLLLLKIQVAGLLGWF